MAFEDGVNFDDQDPLKKDQAGAPGAVGGEAITSGAPTGTSSAQAGAGPGGTGGFTNIQEYLRANTGDTGSAQALNRTIGTQFGNEKNQIQSDSQNFLQDAQTNADQNNINNAQADDYIKQAGSLYSYNAPDAKGGFNSAPSGGSGDFSGGGLQKTTPSKTTQDPSDEAGQSGLDYSGIVNKFQHALNDQYSGPSDYTRELSTQTNDYGNQLKDPGQFDQLMSSIYSGSAGAPLTSGQYQLQKQLDVNNSGLVDARNNLSNQYDDLGKYRDQVVGDTTNALSGLRDQYGNTQNQLRDYLGGKTNDYRAGVDKAEADAKAAYGNEFNTNPLNISTSGGTSTYTPSGIENGMHNMALYNLWKHGDPHGSVGSELFSNADQALNNWYGAEDAKYKDTGDEQKRGYNSLLDFLGSQDPREQQGFKVR